MSAEALTLMFKEVSVAKRVRMVTEPLRNSALPRFLFLAYETISARKQGIVRDVFYRSVWSEDLNGVGRPPK